jgi:phosphatidylglycerophosphate synthase
MQNQTDNYQTIDFVAESNTLIWGLTPRQRIERSLSRRTTRKIPESGHLLFRADHVLEEGLIDALAERPETVLVDKAGKPIAVHARTPIDLDAVKDALGLGDAGRLPDRLARLEPTKLGAAYNKQLRRRGAPYVFDTRATEAKEIERRMYRAAYKGVTDLVTKYVWPEPALWATRLCARRGWSPNLVTLVSLGFVCLATFLFFVGEFALGLVAAWAMCFLDTVDGKLARVTLTASRMGDVFDHGIDLVHPPFWYWAWFAGLGGAVAVPDWSLWVIVIGYVLGRLQEGLFLFLFGLEIHVWRKLDSWFRLVTARRNPNLLILTVATLVGEPALGFVVVAWWTILSFAFHCARIAQALVESHQGSRPASWLAEGDA